MTQSPVRSPFFGKLYGRPCKVASKLFQFTFKARKQGERISGGPGKTGQNLTIIETTDFLSALLNNNLPQSDLAISSHSYFSVFSNANDRGTSDHDLLFLSDKERIWKRRIDFN